MSDIQLVQSNFPNIVAQNVNKAVVESAFNLHVSKNLNISKTKQVREKLKTSLWLVWQCCSDALKIESTIFRRICTLKTPRRREIYISHLKL